jgi:hypothetical protein
MALIAARIFLAVMDSAVIFAFCSTSTATFILTLMVFTIVSKGVTPIY